MTKEEFIEKFDELMDELKKITYGTETNQDTASAAEG